MTTDGPWWADYQKYLDTPHLEAAGAIALGVLALVCLCLCLCRKEKLTPIEIRLATLAHDVTDIRSRMVTEDNLETVSLRVDNLASKFDMFTLMSLGPDKALEFTKFSKAIKKSKKQQQLEEDDDEEKEPKLDDV